MRFELATLSLGTSFSAPLIEFMRDTQMNNRSARRGGRN